MDSSKPGSPMGASSEAARSRPAGLTGFLRGPRLADGRGFGFLILIFVLVLVVFGVAFYAFVTTLRPTPPVPIVFAPAYMSRGNGTFNVTSDGNGSWTWSGFVVNLSINNVGGVAVPLAASGQNATLLIGTSVHKDAYHIVWMDRDRDGAVSGGDTFLVTGEGVGLPSLSYVQFSLTWEASHWTATEYFVTSSAIV